MMSDIIRSMMKILELAGGRYSKLPNFNAVRSELLLEFHKIGVLSVLVTAATKGNLEEHITWEQFNAYHPNSLSDVEFTMEFAMAEIKSSLFSEKAIKEMAQGAGWFLEQERELYNNIQTNLREKHEGWRMRVGRAYWAMAVLGFLLIFAATISGSEIWWSLDAGQLAAAALAFLVPTCFWAWIVLRPVKLGPYVMEDETVSQLVEGRRNPIARQMRLDLTVSRREFSDFLDKEDKVYKISLAISSLWAIFLIGLHLC